MEIKNRIYIAGFHYEEDTLRFVQHGEGRTIPGPVPGSPSEYQYNLTDHLGNVRVTVADNAGEQDTYTATIETANNTVEANDFGDSYTNATKITAAIYNHTETTGSEKSIRLSGAQGEVIGLAKSLRVYPGDTISMEVFAKYVQPDPNANASDVGAFIAAGFLNSFGITSGIDGGNQETFDFFGDLFAMGPVFNNSNTDGAPNAYLNYMLYDDDFVLIDAGFQSVSEAALEDGSGTTHEQLSMETIVNKEGYMYIYLSNEHDKLVDVFFPARLQYNSLSSLKITAGGDDFTIVHKKSPIVQTEDYYPFGLSFNQQTRENTQAQNYLYNGKELQTDLGLNWMDYGARMYDASIGRFTTTDPFGDERNWLTPYNYVQNNPIIRIDPTGALDVYGLDTESGNIKLLEVTDDKTDKLVDSGSGKTISEKVDKGLLKDGQNIMKNGLETTNVKGGRNLVVDISMHTKDEVGGTVYRNNNGDELLSVQPYEHSIFGENENGEVIEVLAGFTLPLDKREFTSQDGTFTGKPKWSFHTHPGHPDGIGNIGTAIPSGNDILGALVSRIPSVIYGSKTATYKGQTGDISITDVPSIIGTNGRKLQGLLERIRMRKSKK